MIGDMGMFFDDLSLCDVRVKNHDLVLDEGLRTSILLSLFTDARVTEEELPEGEEILRGWWGNQFTEGEQMGSKLWLLSREKRTIETLTRAEDYSKEALAWMIADGVAQSVDVQAIYDQKGFMILTVSIQRPKATSAFKFETKWQIEVNANGIY